MNFFKNNGMNFFEYKAIKVWFTDTDVFVELKDGRKSSLPVQRFPLLAKAAKSELEKVEIIGGYALHWPLLGEDLSVAGFFENRDEMLARH
jgi:hypothetical protein